MSAKPHDVRQAAGTVETADAQGDLVALDRAPLAGLFV